MPFFRMSYSTLVFSVVVSLVYGSTVSNDENTNNLKTLKKDEIFRGQPLGHACSKNPCKNGGTCKLESCLAFCECPAPYKGNTCEKDACTDNPCKNGGTCRLTDYNSYCECPVPYKGHSCEEGPCTPNPCLYNGTCTVLNGKANCTCLKGAQGDFCEKACFHGSSIVLTKNGEKEMKYLEVDEEVASGFLPDGSFTYSPVIAFLHKQLNTELTFIQITTDSGATLLISETHLIFRNTDKGILEAVHADKINIGDSVYTKNAGKMAVFSSVVELKSLVLKGIYAPLTLDGTIVVNSILASCYAEAKSHEKSHILFFPLRVLYYLKRALNSLDWIWNLPMIMSAKPIEKFKDDNARMLEAPELQGIHWYPKMLLWLAGSK